MSAVRPLLSTCSSGSAPSALLRRAFTSTPAASKAHKGKAPKPKRKKPSTSPHSFQGRYAAVQQETRELERKVRVADKRLQTEELTRDLPALTADDISELYKALMASPTPTPSAFALPSPSSSSAGALPPPDEQLLAIRQALLDEVAEASSAEPEAQPRAGGGLAARLRKLIEERTGRKEEQRDSEEQRRRAVNAMWEAESRVVREVEERREKGVVFDEGERETLLRRWEEAVEAVERSRATSTADPKLSSPSSDLASDFEALTAELNRSSSPTAPSTSASALIPLGLATPQEWHTLILSAAHEASLRSAVRGLRLLQRAGDPLNVSETFEDVLAVLAKKGEVGQVEAGIRGMQSLGLQPNASTYSHLIHAHLSKSSLTPARSLLHTLESHRLFPPQSTYTAVISAHLNPALPFALHQRGWDLFAHSRLVAHPIPSPELYAHMIASCGYGPRPEPERALDLYREMTQTYHLPADEGVYSATIRALAKSPKFYGETQRLLNEMLDKGIFPTKHTFAALLEAAKRRGDVARARHILAQWIRGAEEMGWEDKDRVDESAMARLFFTYAAFKPVFKRSDVRRSPGAAASSTSVPSESDAAAAESEATLPALASDTDSEPADALPLSTTKDDSTPLSFTPLPPQTSGEVLAEARALLSRVLHDRRFSLSPSDELSDPDDLRPFRAVSPTARFLNAFLAVHAAHSTPSAVLSLYRQIFLALQLEPNGHTYVLLLEMLAKAQGEEGDAAREVWKAWVEWKRRVEEQAREERRWEGEGEGVQLERRRWERQIGLDSGMVTRAWVAMIRFLALNNRLPESLALLRRFVTLYPPTAVRVPTPQPEGPVPTIRLPRELPPDLPPHLTFHDIDVVHHALLRKGDFTELAFIKWLLRAYEGGFREKRTKESQVLDRQGVKY